MSTTDQTVPLDPPSAPGEHAAPTATAEPAASVPPVEGTLGPRIRWAGIVSGLVFAALAVAALVTIGTVDGRDTIRAAILGFDPSTINPGSVIGVVAIMVGVVLLIVGGLTFLRHAQRRVGA